MSRNLSRKDFLKEAAAGALGVAALGLVGCNSTPPPTAATATPTAAPTVEPVTQTVVKEVEHSWDVTPDTITNATVKGNADVVIIGGGYSGACAAASCAEQGLSVILIEKDDKLNGHGVGGTGVVDSRELDKYASEGYKIDKEINMARWVKTCGGRCRESLVAKMFREGRHCMNWLLDIAEADGAKCIITANASNSVVHKEEHSYHWLVGGSASKTYGMALAVPYLLYQYAEKMGGDKFVTAWNTSALQLVRGGTGNGVSGRVTGVICKDADGGYVEYDAAKAVILSTGDISYDDEMLETFAPIGLKVMARLCNDAGNTGDGHKMAKWVGAAWQDGPWPTMMHPQAAAGFHGPFLFLNQKGERFMNEATWVQGKCVGVMHNGHDSYAWSIFDSHWQDQTVESLKTGGGMFWDSFRAFGSDASSAVESFNKSIENGLEKSPNNYKRCDTLEELADAVGIDRTIFLAAVDHYNSLCEAGEDTDFYKEKQFLFPIKDGPFYATRVGTGLLAVVGGVHISDNFEVIDENEEIIDGLYAIGNVSGDAYAYDYPINIQGNSHGRCLIEGKLIGEYIGGKRIDSASV